MLTAAFSVPAWAAEPDLRTDCLRIFGGTHYVGTVKNASPFFVHGRAVIYSFTTQGQIVTDKHGKPSCRVSATWNADNRAYGNPVVYYFAGGVAKSVSPTNPNNWLSWTVRGNCLVRAGQTIAPFGAYGTPIAGTTDAYPAQEGDPLFCPK
jgi:hypothetical protein